MHRATTHTLLAAALLATAATAHAIDGISFEAGSSDSSNASLDMARVGVQWNWSMRWALGPNWHIGGYWDLSLGRWKNDSPGRTNSGVTDFGITPVFRLQSSGASGVSPYVELGIGAHVLSASSVSTERRFGTRFQFGDHVGIGLRFGSKGAFDIGYRYQHLSNAGIKQPNQGINFHQLRVQYHF